ncbi:MAG: hypothetical protein LDL30_12405 [Desulfovibrio sp.]|nr:hypothetical protein [Desulfovibrio sp.]MCA1985720.1 hypothetical protein [Desulfovibrio sp.]
MRTVGFYTAGIGFFVLLYCCVFFTGRIRERVVLLDALIAGAMPAVDAVMQGPPSSTHGEATAIVLARAIYDRMHAPLDPDDLDMYERLESMSPLNVSAATALKHGGFGLKGHSRYGPCTTMSRTLILALRRLKMQARALYLEPDERGLGGGHQLVEFLDEGMWKVIAPSDNAFVWRTRQGRVATAAEIAASEEIFSQVYESFPHYTYLFHRPTRLSLPDAPAWVQSLLALVLPNNGYGPEAPIFFHSPRGLMLRLCLVLASLCAGVAIWLRPRRYQGE